MFHQDPNEKTRRNLQRKNILKGPNFAGLLGESIMKPVHLLNNICEEACKKDKELWILFQDIAKAKDTFVSDRIGLFVNPIRFKYFELN